jgi:hypothetical protein
MKTGASDLKRSFRVLVLAFVLAFSVVLAACDTTTVTQPVVDLAGPDQLAEAFNNVDSGSPRLILLLSPT